MWEMLKVWGLKEGLARGNLMFERIPTMFSGYFLWVFVGTSWRLNLNLNLLVVVLAD